MLDRVVLPSGVGEAAFLRQIKIELRFLFKTAYKLSDDNLPSQLIDRQIDYSPLIGVLNILNEADQSDFSDIATEQLLTDFKSGLDSMLEHGRPSGQITMRFNQGWHLHPPLSARSFSLDGLFYLRELSESAISRKPHP